MGGLYPSFIFLEAKLTFLSYACIFVVGWICSTLWNYMFNLGSSAILLKRVLAAALLFVLNVVDEVQDLQELKRYELERTGKTEKQLELQKKIDEKEINIFKRKIIRVIKSNFPPAYSHLVKFEDWDSMLKSTQKQLNKGG